MLVQADAQALMRKPGFLDRMPEFVELASRPELRPRPGACRGCARRRIERDVFSHFIGIASRLNPEALARLKSELGLEAFMYYGLNRTTGKYEMRSV